MDSSQQTPIGETASISCERCRRRKIKCDRRQPCSRCHKAGTECTRVGIGEKQRPMPKSYVQALEGQVASLELFIKKLASVESERRDEMLLAFRPGGNGAEPAPRPVAGLSPNGGASSSAPAPQETAENNLVRSRAGQMRRQLAGNASHFYGGTSLFQIHLAGDAPASNELLPGPDGQDRLGLDTPPGFGQSPDAESLLSFYSGPFRYAPHDDISQRLMAVFFKEQYQYNMCVYREYFLRDYDIGTGRYYSDMLLYAICAMGALATGDPSDIALSDIFSAQAQSLLYSSLDSPDLTALQALLLLGQREIGRCRASKGWLFCGMAFRLAHEMGLHLDPNNWDGVTEPDIDREVLRRVYWASFIADKQLSLYFGRPPALYPHESDVRSTVRIPYPPDWEGLLDTYIAPGTSVSAFEDGIALVGAFIYQAELSKIQHSIITDLFENRRANADNATVAATIQQIHVALTKWLARLPGKLYWNQWTVGQVPPGVLHLHMRFHTAMIILHRPPRRLFSETGIATSESVEICYESMQAICRLMRSYSRFYRYECLPLDFVHTLSTAASTILMKRYFEGVLHDEAETSRSLSLILEAVRAIKATWPSIEEIERSIVQASQTHSASVPETEPSMDIGFMTGLSQVGGHFDWLTNAQESGAFGPETGFLLTDEMLGETFPSDLGLDGHPMMSSMGNDMDSPMDQKDGKQ